MRFCFDLDNTICVTEGTEYDQSTPILAVVDLINHLYKEGHYVIIFTARGSKSQINFRELTERQLMNWGISYHELLFGKPYADIFIDDRAITANCFHEISQSMELDSSIVDYISNLVNHGRPQEV